MRIFHNFWSFWRLSYRRSLMENSETESSFRSLKKEERLWNRHFTKPCKKLWNLSCYHIVRNNPKELIREIAKIFIEFFSPGNTNFSVKKCRSRLKALKCNSTSQELQPCQHCWYTGVEPPLAALPGQLGDPHSQSTAGAAVPWGPGSAEDNEGLKPSWPTFPPRWVFHPELFQISATVSAAWETHWFQEVWDAERQHKAYCTLWHQAREHRQGSKARQQHSCYTIKCIWRVNLPVVWRSGPSSPS